MTEIKSSPQFWNGFGKVEFGFENQNRKSRQVGAANRDLVLGTAIGKVGILGSGNLDSTNWESAIRNSAIRNVTVRYASFKLKYVSAIYIDKCLG